jgi:hypothetical protein
MGRSHLATMFALLSLGVTVSGTTLHALPITYTERVVASGTLGSFLSFEQSTLTITGTGETTSVVFDPGNATAAQFTNNVSAASFRLFSISFNASGTFTNPFAVFNVPSNHIAGWLQVASGDVLSEAVLGTESLDLAGYFLNTDISAFGTPIILDSAPTSAGDLVLTDVSGMSLFEARVVPGPIVGAGLPGLAAAACGGLLAQKIA